MNCPGPSVPWEFPGWSCYISINWLAYWLFKIDEARGQTLAFTTTQVSHWFALTPFFMVVLECKGHLQRYEIHYGGSCQVGDRNKYVSCLAALFGAWPAGMDLEKPLPTGSNPGLSRWNNGNFASWKKKALNNSREISLHQDNPAPAIVTIYFKT